MNKILKSVGVLLLLSSCASTMLTNKTVQPNEINNLGSFSTISLIRLIEKGNQSRPSDSLSLVSTKIMDSVIAHNSNPKINSNLTVSDDKLKRRLEQDIIKTISEVRSSKKIENIRSTSLMDSIVKSQNQRYALCVVNTGFDRRKGNYGNQIAKSIGIGILTMGMYAPVPVKANTSMYAMIFDAQQSQIIFYNTVPIIEKSPTDRKNLSQLYNRIFDGYFYNKK